MPDGVEDDLYWCVFCGRAITPDRYEYGNVYIHDDVPHPIDLTFDEDLVKH